MKPTFETFLCKSLNKIYQAFGLLLYRFDIFQIQSLVSVATKIIDVPAKLLNVILDNLNAENDFLRTH